MDVCLSADCRSFFQACEEKSKQKQPTKSKKKASDSVSSMMTVVLRVFVDAVPHIPSHRRLVLFEKLVQVVGADQYLWRLILLYIESVTSRATASRQSEAADGEAVVAAMWPGVEEEKVREKAVECRMC